MAQDYFYDVENLSYNLINYGVYDYLSPYKRISTNDVMTWDGDVLTIKGSVGASNINTYIFHDKFHLPFQMKAGKTYLLLDFDPLDDEDEQLTDIWFGYNFYNNNGELIYSPEKYSRSDNNSSITIPDDAIGAYFYVGARNNNEFNHVVAPKLVLPANLNNYDTVYKTQGVPVHDEDLNTLIDIGTYFLDGDSSVIYRNKPSNFSNSHLGLLEVFMTSNPRTATVFAQRLTDLVEDYSWTRYSVNRGADWTSWLPRG